MVVAKIRVNGAIASMTARETITAGMIGAQVHIEYVGPEWDDLDKIVVFRGAAKRTRITNANIVEIPAVVLSEAGRDLCVGVHGANPDGSIAIPTTWAKIGTVQKSVDPIVNPPADDDFPVWAQIRAMIGNLDDLDTEAKNNLVAAVNEVSGSGSSSELPFFDLEEMGLPGLAAGQNEWINTDTTELMAALEKGLVKVGLNIEGQHGSAVLVPMRITSVAGQIYQAIFYAYYGGLRQVMIVVQKDRISISSEMLGG